MNERILQNWQKIKTALEEKNKTDCYLYKRACSILSTGYDPMDRLFSSKK
jgi:hypothetical protein